MHKALQKAQWHSACFGPKRMCYLISIHGCCSGLRYSLLLHSANYNIAELMGGTHGCLGFLSAFFVSIIWNMYLIQNSICICLLRQLENLNFLTVFYLTWSRWTHLCCRGPHHVAALNLFPPFHILSKDDTGWLSCSRISCIAGSYNLLLSSWNLYLCWNLCCIFWHLSFVTPSKNSSPHQSYYFLHLCIMLIMFWKCLYTSSSSLLMKMIHKKMVWGCSICCPVLFCCGFFLLIQGVRRSGPPILL